VGASVTIAGANFGATQGTSTVAFNGVGAVPTSWSATSIVAPVPAGATTGNVVVTVGGVASNGMSFTVTADTTAPVVTITAPTNNATVSSTISLTATATDPDSVVSFVQFLVDGTNTGPQLTTSPYSISLDTTTLSNGTHTLTATGQDPSGNKGTSPTVTITVSNSAGTGATGPLRALAGNAHYFTDGSGKAILLTGSQTWDTFQDLDMSTSPAAFDFTSYVNFLKSHGHNVTILWRKDLPTYCNWGAGGTWHVEQFPWKRTGGSSGTQVASDGLPAFDLTQLDQTYFDRLRARVVQLQQNGIYADVELFDGLDLLNNRCSNDGYPFTGGNNVNGVDDGGGTNSMTMSARNSITDIQEAYVKKVVDTLNDLPNVLWEISEEAPTNSTWWQAFMIDLLHAYEGGGTISQTGEVFSAKVFKHPVHYPTLQYPGNDSALPNSKADVVSPTTRISGTSTCGTGTPPCKVNINDSDHSYYGMWNDSAQTNRNYVWENFANGNQVMFMDPYLIYWSSGNRNLCQSPSNGVCTGPDSRWNNMRDNLGYTLGYANKMDLAKMTPQGNLSSTGYCLAQTPSVGAEYLVYAPSGGTFTVNLSATTRALNVEWFNPATGGTTSGGAISGGTTQSFTAPFSGDAVLYIVDAAGHN
jgi:flagellar hook assembly protein FlgD